MPEQVKKDLIQNRYYRDYLAAKMDAESFVKQPDSFEDRQPKPLEWQLHVQVNKAVLYKGERGDEPHRVVLYMEVSADNEERIMRWDAECKKRYGKNPATLHISDDEKLALARAKAKEQQQANQDKEVTD
jgi:hypothetical protein